MVDERTIDDAIQSLVASGLELQSLADSADSSTKELLEHETVALEAAIGRLRDFALTNVVDRGTGAK